MKDGEKIVNKHDRINNRIFILSRLEHLIKESVYYRTYSEELDFTTKIAEVSVNCEEFKVKIF